jgi:hypothetical protein
MTLPDREAARNWIGRTVVDRDGAEIGTCAALLADEATGSPEWMYAERDEVTVVVPLLDATGSGGRVQVTVARADVDGAPRFGPTRELSQAQEAALYRHYGIEYSSATSDTLLPAAEAEPTTAEPTTAEPTEAAPDAAVEQPVRSGAAQRGRWVAAAVVVLAGLSAAVVAALRRRQGPLLGWERLRRRAAPPPKPAAVRRVLAGTGAARARAVQVAVAAGPLIQASARLARLAASAGAGSVGRAARAGTDSALRVTDAVTASVAAAVPRVAAGAVRAGGTGLRAVLTVGAAAEAVPAVVAETGGRLEKGWRRAMGRLSLGLGFGVGYVLGARAGRARYEQIKQAAAGVMERPQVQQALEKARTAAPAPLQGSIDKLSGRGSGRREPDADTVAVDTVMVEEVDIVVTPPPPASGTAGPGATDAPRPDPLLPPTTPGDDPTGRP